ncbi:uncharacterized protein [Rutidosis leptorrhynchoides]|uniref:uncharacterized protein n=1 Tax=Rutidosis leptorrhynchoides TaxID=125765 RepID=UPI003A992EB3
MGCSTSKLDDEEAVQLCKDRKRFIKQAVEQRTKFASGHLAYIQSLKRVSAALRDYVEGDEPREFFLDSFITPVKNKNNAAAAGGFISNSLKTPPQIQSNPKTRTTTTLKVNYLRSGGGNPAIVVEERPQSPETVHVQSYNYPMMQNYGNDPRMQSSPSMNYYNASSFFSYGYSPNNRPSDSSNGNGNIYPPSPQNSQWDFFWNPFSSLDYYGHPSRSSLDQMVVDNDDDDRGLRQVREEEGIPELEEDEITENEEMNATQDRVKVDSSTSHVEKEEVTVEDVGDEEDEDDDDTSSGTECGCDCEHGVQPRDRKISLELSRSQTSGRFEVGNRQTHVVGNHQESVEETQGYTVYVNRRPTSMAEVIKDLDEQFTVVCKAANEVAALLEASRAQYSVSSNELSAMKMLNPVTLFRSASSRSTSSRFLVSASKEEGGYESSSDISEESCMFSGSHQSTLDRLYAWEKKLYEQVKAGEKLRIAYEKKCNHLRNQDVKGEDPLTVDKTRAAIRDLHTQIKVSIHSVEAISKRIETLRDEELQPQLYELLEGLARMWKIMAECHQTQKRTLDEAKLLLAETPSKLEGRRRHSISIIDPQKLERSAGNLETELRNWRTCFHSWIASQRSYMCALTSWLLRCVRSDPDTSKHPLSPRRSSCALPIFGLCIQWSKFLDSVHETPVLDGLDFFAAGMGSIYMQHQREESTRKPIGSKRWKGVRLPDDDESGGNMDLVEVSQVEEVMTPEKLAEVAVKVLCAGMSVATSSLSEFAIRSADGYADLVKKWENAQISSTDKKA